MNFAERRGPNLATTYALCALALVALRVLLMPIAPHDFWWHLAEGRRISQTSAVPILDYASYLRAGQPFFDQMWLSQWLLFTLHKMGGLPLIIFNQCLLVTGSYALLLWLAARRGGDAKIAAAVLALGVMPVSFDNWLTRPQSFALPCFAIFVCLLTAYRLGWLKWGLWLLPIVEIFWVNLHGSFPLGIILVALTLLGEGLRYRRRQREAPTRRELAELAVCALACLAATLCNPRGVEIFDYLKLVLNSPQTRLSAEWLPPDFVSFGGVAFWLFAVAFVGICFTRRWRLTLTDFVVTLPFCLQAAREGRSIIWFAMAALPVLATALARRRSERQSEERPQFNRALIGAVWLLPVAVLPWWKPALGLPPQIGALIDEETPVAAVRALRALPNENRPQRLWHDEATGSYLMWAAPEQKIFNDTRFEFYTLEQWADATDLRYARRAPEIIARYRFDGFILSRVRHAALIEFLAHQGGWCEVHRDHYWLVLARNAAARGGT